MATRLTLPAMPKLNSGRLREETRRALHEVSNARPSTRNEWKQALWTIIFLPYWIWSDMSAPRFPERDLVLPPGGLAGEHVKTRLRSISGRTWLERSLNLIARSLTLTMLILAVWQALGTWRGFDVRYGALPWIFAGLLIPALFLALCSRPSNAQVARMLDRSFGLQERLVTALANIGQEVPGEGERAGIRYLQVADAANALVAIRGNRAFRIMPPVRELVLAIVFGLAFASLFFLRGGHDSVPVLQSAVVPEFIPAAQRFITAPDPSLPVSPLAQNTLTAEELQAIAEQAGNARQDLMTLAGAMDDHEYTRAAAGELQEGNYDSAVETLRSISSQAGDLTQSERESLASDLESAAGEMTESGQNLANAANEAAEGLREGGAGAQEGIENIADAIEQTAEQISSGEGMGESSESLPQSGSQSSGESSESNGEPQSLFDQQMANQNSPSSSQANSAAGESAEQSAESGGSEQGESNASGEEGGQGQSGESGSGRSGSEAAEPSEDFGSGGEGANDDSMNVEGQPSSAASESSTSGTGAGTESSAGSDTPGSTTGGGVGSENLPEASESNVVDDSLGAGSDDAAGNAPPGGSLSLNRMPNGQAVPVQGAGSRSNLGSGAGMTSGGGGSTQGKISDPGPDSNHVPAEYRSIVESYFSAGDE